MDLRTGSIAVVFLFAVSILSGCAAMVGDEPKRDIVSGMGKMYSPRGKTDEDMPRLQLDALVQCEDRTPESAIREFVGVLNNTIGWTQVVTSVATTQERMVGEAVGEDRAEQLFTLTLDNPSTVNDLSNLVKIWIDSVQEFNNQNQQCQIPFGSGQEGGS